MNIVVLVKQVPAILEGVCPQIKIITNKKE